ncbi:MAG: hypothetical protein RLZZ206_832 [Cyanobacteriota bacterium]
MLPRHIQRTICHNDAATLKVMATAVDPQLRPYKIKQTKSRYRPEIDGLRAFAVIAVIINHFNEDWLPSGYLGVDIFFVISGYVITSSLSGRESRNFGDFLSSFYERRIKRLVPALAVFVLVASILICLFNPNPGVAIRTGIRSLFGLSNLYLFRQSTDYFAESTQLNIFAHTWSLGVEEQFYLLFPFLIWFSGFGRKSNNGARNLFAWIGSLSAASLASFIYLYQTNQPAAYFLMPPRFWEMAAGCLIFIGLQKRPKIEQALERVPPLLVLSAMIGTMLLPVSAAVPATIGIVAISSILIVCLKSGSWAFNVFTHKKIVYLGMISYSLYLWHWGILSISRWSLGIHWWSVPFQIAIMILLSSASYSWIENPLRKKIWKIKKFTTVPIGFAAATSAALLMVVISNRSESIYAGKNYNKDSLTKLVINGRLIDDKECNSRQVAEAKAQDCIVMPKIKSKPTFWLMGDSHMQHYLPLFEKLAKEYGFGYRFFGRGGFPVGRRMLRGKIVSESDSNYALEKAIYTIKPGDFLVISERQERNFAPKTFDQGKNQVVFVDLKNNPISKQRALDNYSNFLFDIYRRVKSKGASMVIFQPSSSFPAETSALASICLEWFARLNPICKMEGSTNRDEVMSNLVDIRRMHINLRSETNGEVILLDPMSMLCPSTAKKCDLKIGNKLLYLDDDHLSATGALLMKKSFLNAIGNIHGAGL